MRASHAVTWLALMVPSGIAALGCGLADVFRPAGLESVTLAYVGDTLLAAGDTVWFTVTVQADGVPLAQPRLRITSSDTSVIGLTGGLDSLIARNRGTATLTMRLESSILSDTAPTLVQPLRVRP